MRTLYWYELKMFARDRTTIFFSIILPVILMPILFKVVISIKQRKDNILQTATYNYLVTGPHAKLFREQISPFPNFQEFPSSETPFQRLRGGFFDVLIETHEVQPPSPTPSPTAEAAKDENPRGRIFGPPAPGRPSLTIYFLADRDRSGGAHFHLVEILRKLKVDYRDQALAQAGLAPDKFLVADPHDIATEQSKAGAKAAPWVPLMLVFLLLGGASVAAVDSVAGERERGTLDTLLTTCLPQSSIVIAKQLAVLSLALFITIFELSNLFLFIHLGWIEANDFLHLDLGLGTFGLLALLGSILAVTVSSLLLYVSASSSNFKEAQLALFPAMIITISLTAAGIVPDFRLNSAIALVPVTSISVAIREVLCGTVSWPGLAVCGLVHLAVSGWLLWACREKLIPPVEFRGSRSDSLAIIEQRRSYLVGELPWVFAIILAAMITIPGNFPGFTDLTGQVLLNQGMMLLLPAGMLLRHGISLREGLRLRPFGWKVLIAALVLAPLCVLCANSVVWLTGELFPIPQDILKQMEHMILQADQPTWVLVIMVALCPAICEEIAFRGALLYALSSGGEAHMSLRRKLKVSALVGLAFGAFHAAPFISRGIPTGLLGAVLAWLALETGSIVPGMIVHFGNNAIAVLSQRGNVELGDLPPWTFGVAWIALISIFIWLRRGGAKGTATGMAN